MLRIIFSDNFHFSITYNDFSYCFRVSIVTHCGHSVRYYKSSKSLFHYIKRVISFYKYPYTVKCLYEKGKILYDMFSFYCL